MRTRTWTIARWLLAGMAWLAIAGCGAGDDGAGRLTPEEASARVSELLYERNLIADPEVNAKVNEYVLGVSRDGVPADSLMPALHQWLAGWAQAHPDRAASARLLKPAPVTNPGPNADGRVRDRRREPADELISSSDRR